MILFNEAVLILILPPFRVSNIISVCLGAPEGNRVAEEASTQVIPSRGCQYMSICIGNNQNRKVSLWTFSFVKHFIVLTVKFRC